MIDLEPKEVPKKLLSRGIGEDQKLRLAEEIIREHLATEGLEFEEVSEKFAKIVVADVIASEE